jgi:hypothetical protein
VFFDEMELNWQYEVEGFDLDGEFYLPDFRVQTGDLTYWYEVKPESTKQDNKFGKFSDAIEKAKWSGVEKDWSEFAGVESRLLIGDPLSFWSDQLDSGNICPRCGRPVELESFGNEYEFNCESCDPVTASGGDNPWEVGFSGIEFYPHKGWIVTTPGRHTAMVWRIEQACLAARSARFEHGEYGRQ